MKTALVEETRVKRYRAPAVKAVRQQTFEEWLVEEAEAGRMILASCAGNAPLPERPRGTKDFWGAYNETRADRF